MEETVQEQTDDEPLEYLVHLLQEEPLVETPTKEPSTVDHTTHLYEELQPGYKVPTVLTPSGSPFVKRRMKWKAARGILPNT